MEPRRDKFNLGVTSEREEVGPIALKAFRLASLFPLAVRVQGHRFKYSHFGLGWDSWSFLGLVL